MTNADCHELIDCLIGQLNREGDLLDAITHGLSANTLGMLVRAAAVWLSTNWRLQLSVRRPFYHTVPYTIPPFVSVLDDHLQNPHTAAILSVQYHCVHWTVVRSIGAKSLMLVDSAGHDQLRQKAVSLRADASTDSRRLLFPHSVFLLEAKPLYQSTLRNAD